uniref:Uncharacterized protein n=1 Tax=Knipowitschia caucasica TaxID=637954 RepID=A0AAV2IU70_KNICA
MVLDSPWFYCSVAERRRLFEEAGPGQEVLWSSERKGRSQRRPVSALLQRRHSPGDGVSLTQQDPVAPPRPPVAPCSSVFYPGRVTAPLAPALHTHSPDSDCENIRPPPGGAVTRVFPDHCSAPRKLSPGPGPGPEPGPGPGPASVLQRDCLRRSEHSTLASLTESETSLDAALDPAPVQAQAQAQAPEVRLEYEPVPVRRQSPEEQRVWDLVSTLVQTDGSLAPLMDVWGKCTVDVLQEIYPNQQLFTELYQEKRDNWSKGPVQGPVQGHSLKVQLCSALSSCIMRLQKEKKSQSETLALHAAQLQQLEVGVKRRCAGVLSKFQDLIGFIDR